MLRKQSIQTLLLGLVLGICLWVGMGQTPALAAIRNAESIVPEQMPAIPEALPDLASGVDHFLTSMPAGYYAIANVEGLKSRLENPQALLVDVREPSEYRSGHIPHAINIPLRSLAHNLAKIPHDHPVVLYCSSGYRSAMGVMTLHLLGYDNVQGFPPSFTGWTTAGETIAKS